MTTLIVFGVVAYIAGIAWLTAEVLTAPLVYDDEELRECKFCQCTYPRRNIVAGMCPDCAACR